MISLYTTNGNITNEVKGYVEEYNQRYNLPPMVVFPVVPGDVVTVVNFANKYDIELSVKASGHNYATASTKKETLLVNMRNMTTNGDVDECLVDESISDDLSNQACYLVGERKLSGYLKVHGGESFGSAYKTVHNFNERQSEQYKYLLVGGAAPVSTVI